MASLSDIGKKITQIKNSTTQKTQNIVEVLKLKNELTEKKKNLDRLFTALGRKYYFTNPEALDADMESILSKIKEENEIIDELNRQITAAEQMKLCPFCGAKIDLEKTFCTNCGNPIDKTK